MNYNFLLDIAKKTSTGIFIGFGIMISVFGVFAFESLTSNPADSGNQSLSSPLLSKIGGIFDRDTMSLEAIARSSVNWGDCEFKVAEPTRGSNTTVTCSAGYTLVDHSCSTQGARGSSRDRGKCKLTGIDSLWVERSGTNGTWPQMGSIKCCKYLVQ